MSFPSRDSLISLASARVALLKWMRRVHDFSLFFLLGGNWNSDLLGIGFVWEIGFLCRERLESSIT